ncbi:MAG: PSD1 and planctomycete cytochrome C domain-containing protein [Chthoniobacteraceae bacterium]
MSPAIQTSAKCRPVAVAVLSSVFVFVSMFEVRAEDGDDYFEKKVRPLLVERCFECHSHEKKVKGGLALDSRSAWEKGGDTGPALIPGKPEDSLLIKAVSYTDPDLSMPPKKRLSADEVAVLTEWVKLGAPDPRVEVASAKKVTAMTLDEARSYWAFQPIRRPEPPVVKDAAWPRSDIDHFILSQLENEGLKPNPQADPRTVARRVYFDLIGLPPSFEQVEAFAQSAIGNRQSAMAALVDELLARPEYGQRWGRHWLDVARYSDTTEKSTDGERRIPFAHTYRDYVIDAFNADKPFDRFVLEQVAADRMPSEAKPDLRALGFLTVGRRFEGNIEAPQLIVDDRIDVIGRGLLGLTLACARCHDHKFDAIPAADYYSLYGIIASSGEPMDLPEVGAPAVESDAVKKYRAERATIFTDYEKHIDACVEKSKRLLRELAPEYLRRIVETSPKHQTVAGFVPLDTPRGLLVRGGAPRWDALIAESLRRGEPFFQLWSRLIALDREGFAENASAVIAEAASCSDAFDPLVVFALQQNPPASMLDVADIYGRLISESLRSSGLVGIAALIGDPDSPLQFNREEIREDLLLFVTEHQLVSRPDGEKAGTLRQKLTALEAGAPVERALVVNALATPVAAQVMVRGDRHKLGAATPRRFLHALAAVDDREYLDDGRLELAQAIASARNPLTARVIVNRVWQQHFGHGLVATPDNFGAMGERLSHPELLDHLAAWFIEHGWSLKALHRYILASATWQQSSAIQPLALEKDPANRLLWRMSPRRLEFEPMRDALLAVAGRLDTRLGGRSAPLDDKNQRRAVYGYTDRFRIPALLRNFDVANPDTSISRRAETIHPLQALYFLNSPFVRAQAEAVVRLPAVTEACCDHERIDAIYRRVLSRHAADDELKLAEGYLGDAPSDRQWANLAQGLLLSNEFIFCD